MEGVLSSVLIALVALVRKTITIGIVAGGIYLVDKRYLKTIDIIEVLKNAPNALAILLGLFAVAFALA